TSRVCKGFHPAMVGKTGTVERHLLNTRSLRLFCDTLADQGRSRGVAAFASTTDLCTHFGFGSGGSGQHTAAIVGNHARVDVQVGAVHGQANGALLRNADARLTGATETLLFFGQHDPDPYFFLVSLITTFSS